MSEKLDTQRDHLAELGKWLAEDDLLQMSAPTLQAHALRFVGCAIFYLAEVIREIKR